MKEYELHKNCTHEILIKNGFKKYGQVYRLNTPLYEYKNYPTVSVEFQVSFPNTFEYEVVDNNSENIYVSFYNPTEADKKNNLVLKKVKRNLKKKLKEFIKLEIIQEV